MTFWGPDGGAVPDAETLLKTRRLEGSGNVLLGYRPAITGRW